MNQSYIRSLSLKNFRCFGSRTFDFDSPVIVIEGANGSGKTSLLEAIHYACYMRSFRALSPREMIRSGEESFFVTSAFDEHTVSVGVLQTGLSTTQRQVKVDGTTITSHKELRSLCRVVTTTEDDLLFVKGSPDRRRLFIDHALFLLDNDAMDLFRIAKEVLDNRNALLHKHDVDEQQLLFWTQKLWDVTCLIQTRRKALLDVIAQKALTVLSSFWPDSDIVFDYQAKEMTKHQTFEGFFDHASREGGLFEKEKRLNRTLFGSHLDDIEMTIGGKKARYYSSRGQQKLIVMAFKLALVEYLTETQGRTAFLLDDFTTDFDEGVIDKLMELCLQTSAQLIFVSPLHDGRESKYLVKYTISSLRVSL